MTESPLISFEGAAELLQIHHTTIRQRKAGTEMLTHVSGLGRRRLLVRAEVQALADKLIDRAVELDQGRKTLLRQAG